MGGSMAGMESPCHRWWASRERRMMPARRWGRAGGDWTSWTSSRGGQGANSDAGGGHSHCGLMIYQGEGFPESYRGTPFLANIHGNRINNDHMSMGTSLQYGPDGGVYYTDWYDGDECHTHKPDRTTGRVYKITYKTTE